MDFGGGPLAANDHWTMVVLGLDDGGTHRISRAYGGQTFGDQPQVVAAASNGDILLGGWFTDQIDFGTGLLTGTPGDGFTFEAFLVRLDSNGVPRWTHAFGGSGVDATHGLALTAGGDIAIAGQFGGTFRLGPGDQSSAGDDPNKPDGFLALLPAE